MSVINSNNHYDNYTDINGLKNTIKPDDKASGEALHKVAKQFESIMIQMMLKSMRSANEVFAKDNPLKSNASDTYQQMYDDQLSLHLNKGKGIGLAELMVKQLQKTMPHSDTKASDIALKPAHRDTASHQISQALNDSVQDNDEFDIMMIDTVQKIKAKPITVTIHSEQKINETSSTALTSAPKAMSFDGSVDDFVNKLYPYAKQTADKLGVDPSILIAQAALETGWGKSVNKNSELNSSNNLFNIKATGNWQGKQTKELTTEFIGGESKKINANFRAYDNIQDSFDDYYQLIAGNRRYEKAIQANSDEQYVVEMHKAGYATDPNYSEKILEIANGRSMQKAIASISL